MAPATSRRTVGLDTNPTDLQEALMPTYLIEREIPGASKLTDEELRGITTKSNDTVAELRRFLRGDR